jgi:hypothetical protein
VSDAPAAPEAAAIEQGTYEVLRTRLVDQARGLRGQVESLNAKRLELFGGQDMEVIGSEKIRTKNACLPRDIVSIGPDLLFGYEVKLGLKQETEVEDVLGLYSFERKESGFEFRPLSIQVEETDSASLTPKFLDDANFKRDFAELFRYYKNIRLLQLRLVENGTRLLAVFQVGSTINDFKALQWGIEGEVVKYIDNRGERLNAPTPPYEFTWEVAGRDNFVNGKHPHVSILDEVFVETVGGSLTVKVENNTEDGLGIYSEKVEDQRQGLSDAQYQYKKLGHVILLKILPYREQNWRYLIFNTRTHTVHNVKALGDSAIQLPEDHGLIYPGGYYLQEGNLRNFDGDFAGMGYECTVRSPNGEDILYVFRHREQCRFALMSYNMISKEVRSPIHCNGYCLYEDGTLVLFRSPTDGEPSRVHTMQIWRTPFTTTEFQVKQQSKTGSYLESVGNADLVRGVSDCLSVARRVEEQTPTLPIYEDLVSSLNRTLDVYPWLSHEEAGHLTGPLQEIKKTATLVLEEFEKVTTLKKQASKAFEEASKAYHEKARRLNPDDWNTVEQYVDALAFLRTARGQLITLKDMRYAPLEEIKKIEEASIAKFDQVSQKAVEFLLGPTAFVPLQERIEAQAQTVDSLQKAGDAVPIMEELDKLNTGLELLMDVIGGLKIEDATQRTAVLEKIAELMGQLNRARALVQGRKKELGSKESTAEFAVQFQLLTQNATSAINLADSPEKCEQALSRLMLQLEDLEGRFGEYDDYMEQLSQKREDISKSISAKKQTLMEARQRRVQQLMSSAERILEGLQRRAAGMTNADELNAFFASDAMVMKVREVAEKLRELNDPVKADELESRLKSSRQESGRSLRDRQEIFEDGANVIKFGNYRFSVNTEPVDLTMVPRRVDLGSGETTIMALHITGTDFFEDLVDPELEKTREFWDQQLVSETSDVYRAEYLAYCLLDDAEVGRRNLSLRKLYEILLSGPARTAGTGDEAAAATVHPGLLDLVREYAQDRYDEGYDRGIHDTDAALILESLLQLYQSALHLRFSSRVRHVASLYWAYALDENQKRLFVSQSMSFKLMMSTFGPSDASDRLAQEMAEGIGEFAVKHNIPLTSHDQRLAGEYLVEDLGDGDGKFLVSGSAISLRDAFMRYLQETGVLPKLQAQWAGLRSDLSRSYEISLAWLKAFVDNNPQGQPEEHLERWRIAVEEAASILLTEGKVDREASSTNTKISVTGLLGQHNRIKNRVMELRLEDFVARLDQFRQQRVPAYRRYQEVRRKILTDQRRRLRMDEVAPKVMSAFVRNKLINEIYLPLVGANLAKQMGSLGENKRTDQMGLLLLVSPPGYGKTTLMEYVANRLGLIFVKVNGPALGHSVVSLDPNEATSATAKQEVEKVNFALEMGNNVMLYIDDIQHTNPEFLQKFISLCDAQRKVEGVWKGRTRTYDMKGKRFCICMAGNPYTESGARFQIPDMLANRADTYNLGDVMAGKEAVFELSYLENALTSNPTLSPLTSRDPEDVYKLIRMAEGVPINANELSHNYSSVELDEILSVMKKLFKVQRVLLTVNKQYIASAATDDAYRSEPAFKLQGSYRNMTKMTEKVVAIMNDDELERLIDDHYTGEAQTLTTGAEHNLLKLAELRGRQSPAQKERWEEIKRGFGRRQTMGNDDDPVARVSNVLGKVSENLDCISDSISEAAGKMGGTDFTPLLEKLSGGPLLVKVSPDSEVFQAQSQADYTPFLQQLNQTMLAMGKRLSQAPEPSPAGAPAADAQVLQRLTLALEKMGPAPSAAGPDLSPFLQRLTEVIERLGQAQPVAALPMNPGQALPVVSAQAPVQVASGVGPDLSPFLARLTAAMEKMSGSAPAAVASGPSGAELAPVLDKLSRAIERMSSLPAATVTAAGAAPVMMAPTQVQLAPEASSAMVGSLDNLMDIVPKLKEMGERLRGPKAKVILMDAGLVRTFDAFRSINNLADLVKALEELNL